MKRISHYSVVKTEDIPIQTNAVLVSVLKATVVIIVRKTKNRKMQIVEESFHFLTLGKIYPLPITTPMDMLKINSVVGS